VDEGVDMNRVREWSRNRKIHNRILPEGGPQRDAGCGRHRLHQRLSIERIFRDVRLASIWTGTSEVMSMITAHEWYRNSSKQGRASGRDFERDAQEADAR